MCGLREGLVQTRTKLVNSVRGWSRTQGLGTMKSGAPTTFTHRMRKHVSQQKASIPACVERVLVAIEALTEQINGADEELERVAKSDATCQLLMTAPGIGPTASVRMAAAVDDVKRFPNAHKLESYLGMTPGENSSSTRKQRTGLTKAGPAKLRWAMVQAAWVARRASACSAPALQKRGRTKRRDLSDAALQRRTASSGAYNIRSSACAADPEGAPQKNIDLSDAASQRRTHGQYFQPRFLRRRRNDYQRTRRRRRPIESIFFVGPSPPDRSRRRIERRLSRRPEEGVWVSRAVPEARVTAGQAQFSTPRAKGCLST